MVEYTSETVAIPITRWKRGRHGVLPKTEGISKLVDCTPKSAPNIPPVDCKAGFKTTGFVTALPPEPKGKGPKYAIQWLQYADSMTSVAFGLQGFKAVTVKLEPEPEPVIVPRGTFIGPQFERTVKLAPKVKSVVPASSKQASSIGNF